MWPPPPPKKNHASDINRRSHGLVNTISNLRSSSNHRLLSITQQSTAILAMDANTEIIVDTHFFRIYKDGRVARLVGTRTVCHLDSTPTPASCPRTSSLTSTPASTCGSTCWTRLPSPCPTATRSSPCSSTSTAAACHRVRGFPDVSVNYRLALEAPVADRLRGLLPRAEVGGLGYQRHLAVRARRPRPRHPGRREHRPQHRNDGRVGTTRPGLGCRGVYRACGSAPRRVRGQEAHRRRDAGVDGSEREAVAHRVSRRRTGQTTRG
jgi:hypothetical protein